jgi:enterochelin esterase-like enzyme
MRMSWRNRFWLMILFAASLWVFPLESPGGAHPCCPEDPELSYFLSPKPSQKFQYLVRYETFYSVVLGKEKGFFVILPEGFYQNPERQYPVIYLLHGYNFHRAGRWWNVRSPEKAKKVLCEVKEEEYHWLLHQDIAVIAYALTDSKSRTYRDLKKSLEERFEDLSKHGGLAKEDYKPAEIARGIVFHNLHPEGRPDDFFQPLQKMVLVLPDGDNGFYTDENEGKRLFPETKSQRACDDFERGEALNYSLLPVFSMKPGALGKCESYFVELVQHVQARSSYRERILQRRGIGGMSMGGFGAMKLGLKYPHLFQSISSQSGLLDLDLLKDKWTLKMVMPEFLEVFGSLEAKKFPPRSSIDLNHLRENNPIDLLKERGITRLPSSIYFDYGEKEGYPWITRANENFERILNRIGHQVPRQPFNGEAGHNYQFWRSRSANILQHHSGVLRRMD